MAKEPTQRPRGRRWFRRCRQLFLGGVLLLLAAVLYLNVAGVPGFVKNPLLSRLRELGVDADFSRLRWRWHQGFVAEDLVVRRIGDHTGPRFSSREAALRLDLNSLFSVAWRLDSAAFRGGEFSWIMTGTNGAPLLLREVETELRFERDGSLHLQHFSSVFRDLRLHISGTLAHPRALAIPRRTGASPRSVAELNTVLTRLAGYVTNFAFTARPTMHLNFTADAANWDSLSADLMFRLPETRTTWGDARNFKLVAHIRPGDTDQSASGAILLSGDMIETPWGRLEKWTGSSRTVPLLQPPIRSSNEVAVTFQRLATGWGDVEDGRMNVSIAALDESRPDELALRVQLAGARFAASRGRATRLSMDCDAVMTRAGWRPVSGRHVLELEDLRITNASARSIKATVLQRAVDPERPPTADESWGAWRVLEPYEFDFTLEGSGVAVSGVELDDLRLRGSWAAPRLELGDVAASLYGGTLSGRLAVDVPARAIEFSSITDFDFHALDHVFSERFRRWFSPYQWRGTPHSELSGRVRWPDWRNFEQDWDRDVVPTLGVSGRFHIPEASYRGVPAQVAHSNFHFTNFVWHLPNLTIVRPEGRTVASYAGDDRTRDYTWHISADIDPHALKSLFKETQQEAFRSFTNHATPHVEAVIAGRWREPEKVGFRAEISAPQLEVRGERTGLATGTVEYTNRVVTIHDLVIERSNRVARADTVQLDLPNQVMHFTNVNSTLPPMSIARAIGPKTARAVEPYVFREAPQIQMRGRLGLKGHLHTDLEFDVEGGPFQWWRFQLDAVRGRLHWQQSRLRLTNMAAAFYSGDALGAAEFTFFTNRPTEFSYVTTVTNAHLQPLVRDVFARTNNVEGLLSGRIEVTSARADSIDTWQGHGDVNVQDGLLWDFPIFGLFSPVLNALSPGLGQSRANRAGATFTMVNGTVISRDLQIESAQLSMDYQGSVDFSGNVDAIMQARIMRDSGLLGPLISTALWPLSKIFEYRISGTLAEPVAQPLHIPRFLMLALEPFKALQGILKQRPEADPFAPPPPTIEEPGPDPP